MTAAGVTARPTGVRIAVRVTPRAGGDGVNGGVRMADGGTRLQVRVAAAPADGAANKTVISLIAEAFDVSKSAVSITRGESAREKLIDIEGDTAALSQRFMTLVESSNA